MRLLQHTSIIVLRPRRQRFMPLSVIKSLDSPTSMHIFEPEHQNRKRLKYFRRVNDIYGLKVFHKSRTSIFIRKQPLW